LTVVLIPILDNCDLSGLSRQTALATGLVFSLLSDAGARKCSNSTPIGPSVRAWLLRDQANYRGLLFVNPQTDPLLRDAASSSQPNTTRGEKLREWDLVLQARRVHHLSDC
jgi:hypothetical protein